MILYLRANVHECPLPYWSLIHEQQGYSQGLFPTVSQHVKDGPMDIQKYLLNTVMNAHINE